MTTVALSRGRSRKLTASEDSAAVTNDFVRAISEPIRSVPAPKPTPVERKFKSRFFFTLPESTAEEVERLKRAAATSRRRTTESLEEVIQRRVDSYKDEFTPSVAKGSDRVREFFLKEINPLIMASGVGSAQAKDVLQKMLGIEIDGQPYAHFDRLVRKAVQLRLAKFISEYFKVDLSELMQATDQHPKEVLFVNGQETNQRGQSAVPGTLRKRTRDLSNRP